MNWNFDLMQYYCVCVGGGTSIRVNELVGFFFKNLQDNARQ